MPVLAALVFAALVVQTSPPVAGDTLALQVALDRAGFSPGVIDGRTGDNTRRAADLYREVHGRDVEPASDALTTYVISAGDLHGPFARIPDDMMQKAQLPSLTYESALEALAERYHATPDLLRQLNPESRFAEGDEIRVPNVEAFIVPAPRLEPANEPAREERGTAGRTPPPSAPADVEKPDVVVSVSSSAGALVVRDTSGRIVFYAPVTTGSERDPLPLGEWKVTGVQFSPKFHYNPDLFWNADPSHAKATLQPGPNNPVGVVWIDLSKEHYGIHGTPEPSTIGKTTSNGCVRLTNWDAQKVAGLVKPGTRVVFTQ